MFIFQSKQAKVKIQELSIADYKVLSTEFDKTSLKIATAGGYNTKQGKACGPIQIFISNWLEFSIKKFTSDEPFGAMTETELDLKDFEPFEFIQEIETPDNQLLLKGFSDKSGGWMVYKFAGAQVDINFE